VGRTDFLTCASPRLLGLPSPHLSLPLSYFFTAG
jgi:hypothetical protein